jgi:chromosome segregation ATPase
MTTLTETEAAANLRDAREILASLVNKRSDHERKLAELGRERSAIAFAAHQGDAKARKRLDALHLEAAKADSEFLSLDAAVPEAQSRVKDAEAAVSKAEAAAKAERVLSLLPGLRERTAES